MSNFLSHAIKKILNTLIAADDVFIGFHQLALYLNINYKIMGEKCPAADIHL